MDYLLDILHAIQSLLQVTIGLLRDVPALTRLSPASKSGEAAPAIITVTITARRLVTPLNMLVPCLPS